MLDSVVQNADETTEMFADRVLRMTKLRYPSVAEEQQHFMAIDRFVMGLRPSCKHIFEFTKYPSNFNEAARLVARETTNDSFLETKFKTSENEIHSNEKPSENKNISAETKRVSFTQTERPTIIADESSVFTSTKLNVTETCESGNGMKSELKRHLNS